MKPQKGTVPSCAPRRWCAGALEADGKLTPQAKRWLAERTNVAEEAMRFYDVIVRLVCCPHSAPLLEGQGNFGGICYGHPDYPPAHARYTECRITERGLQYLADVGGSAALKPDGGETM